MRTDDGRIFLGWLLRRDGGKSPETQGVLYDARREARGTPPDTQSSPWRPRLLRGAIAGAVLLVVGSVGFVWYTVTHVRAVSGRVRAEVIALSPQIDGHLVELLARTGDKVRKGQALARLEDNEAQAALAAAQATQRSRENALVEARELFRQARTKAEAELGRARSRVRMAEATLALRTAQDGEAVKRTQAQAEESKAALARLRLGSRPEELAAAESRLGAATALQTLYELEVKQSQALVAGGIDSQYLLEVKKTRLLTQESAVRQAELELARLRSGATAEERIEAEQRLAAREAAVAEASAALGELDVLRADLEIRQAELHEAEARSDVSSAECGDLGLAEARMKGAEADLRRAEADVASRQAAVGATTVLSPVDGTITRTYDEVGEMCRRGVPTILVADDSQAPWVEAYVREKDAMCLAVGQAATVKVPASGGWRAAATVVAIGFHTQSMDRPGTTSTSSDASAGRSGQAERVWVRLQPAAPLRGNPVPGTTAGVVIRVR